MKNAITILLLIFVFAGCTDMSDGQRLKPLEESTFYADRLSSRPLPEGTVARGQLNEDRLLAEGKVAGQFAELFPMEVTKSVLQRGQVQYNTFCSPCHGRLGDGKGMIVMRGFPQPNSFHADSVRVRPAGYYVDVMTNGFGRMYSYASSVSVEDRWAVAAYIRALQASQRVQLTDLPQDDQRRLTGN